MSTQQWIDQRLDALDRALLGLLPRSERLAVVADVQARLDGRTDLDVALAEPTAENESAHARTAPARPRRRSGMAFTSGVLGMVACGLLILLPLTYLIVASTGELLGEMVIYALLSLNIFFIAAGGGAAVILGIVSLVRMNRMRGRTGHGWAVTGLCTGPLPALIGSLGLFAFVLPLIGELASNNSVVPCETGTCYPADLSPAVAALPPPASGYAVPVNTSYPVYGPAQPWTPSAPAPAPVSVQAEYPPPAAAPSLSPAPAALSPEPTSPSLPVDPVVNPAPAAETPDQAKPADAPL
jgi:hypothetical protein